MTESNKHIPHNKIIFTDEEEQEIIKLYTEDKISTVKIGKKYNCSHKVIARLLAKHDIERVGNGRRKYSLDEHYFDSIDTPNKAYILGFLYADGCNYIPKQTVSMSLQEDDFEILEKIRICIGNEHPLEYMDYSNKHDFGYTYKNQYRLLMFSKHMCDSLNNIGMTPNKSLTLKFPKIDKNLYRHFIRGYFDGDGCVYKGASTHIATITSTFSFCEEIQKILLKEGIETSIVEASNHNGITAVLRFTKKAEIKKFLDYIYKDAEMYLMRKYNIYLNKYVNNYVA